MTWEFEAEVFAWQGEGAWHFARLPVEVAEEIREIPRSVPTGFGSVRVRARIGETTWATSVFPDKHSGSYLLPVKRAVRVAEGVLTDDVVRVRLTVEGDDGA